MYDTSIIELYKVRWIRTDHRSKLAPKLVSFMGTEVFSKIQKPKQRPSNQDILSAARSACCRLSLETSIEAKFGVLPRRIYLKAAKLCGEHGVKVQWHLKGYICSNGCNKTFKETQNLLSPLIPRLTRE